MVLVRRLADSIFPSLVCFFSCWTPYDRLIEIFRKTDGHFAYTAKGLGAESGPAHKGGKAPGEAPVASDSYTARQSGTTVGEKGNVGQMVGEKPSETTNQGNMK